MKHRLLIMLWLLVVCLNLKAQDVEPWVDLYQQLVTSDEVDDGSGEENYEQLSELYHHPIDLNSATPEDLEQLPFLSEQQVADILEYVYKYGPMRGTQELSMVRSLDRQTWELLSYFVTVTSQKKGTAFPSLNDIMRYGKQELAAYGQIPFYDRKGDHEGYVGYKYRHWLRYTLQDGQWLKLGLIGAQDPGEPFLSNRNGKGYDYYSFFLQLGRLGPVKKLVVGRYRLRAGLGLVINTDISFGKMSMLQNLGRSGVYMRGQTSRSDNYLQGAALTIGLGKHLDLSLFASSRKVDGTLAKDSAAITNINTTGYHRTQHELDRKHNTTQNLVGGDIHFSLNGFHIGATAIYNTLSRDLQPLAQKYRRYYPAGRHFWNASISYGYTSGRFMLNGETATGDTHAVATVNAASVRLSSALQLMAVQRFYSYKYTGLFARSFSSGGRVQNESGIYVGATWKASRALTILAYTDYAYYSWPRYLADDASHSLESLLSANIQKEHWSFMARYRLKLRQINSYEDESLTNDFTHRLRLQLGYRAATWNLRTQTDMTLSDVMHVGSFGWMVTEQGGWTATPWLKLAGSAGYFQTDNYNSRVYSTEPNLLYSFRFPMFYGQGLRTTFMLSALPTANLKLIARLGYTHYFDRDTIGSGLQEINGSSQTDLELQLQWKF